MRASRRLKIDALLACFLWCASVQVGHAQQNAGTEAGPFCPVKVDASVNPSSVSPGGEFKVLITLMMDPGWHVNSHHPLSEHLIPTGVSLLQGELSVLPVGPVLYPSGHEAKLSFSEEPLSVYEGRVSFEMSGSTDKNTPAGRGDILLSIEYQACSDSVCLAPETREIRIPLLIE